MPVGILLARPRRPRDKAKVESGVRFAQTYILGRLRHLTFFSLAECNAAVALVMQRMNERPMRNLGLSRRELFETIERDALIALPADDWEFAEWRRARVNLDYHIEVHDFFYSVPHALIRAEVDVRITARTVEIFHRGQRVATTKARSSSPARFPWTAGRLGQGHEPPVCPRRSGGLGLAAYCCARMIRRTSRNPLTPQTAHEAQRISKRQPPASLSAGERHSPRASLAKMSQRLGLVSNPNLGQALGSRSWAGARFGGNPETSRCRRSILRRWPSYS